MPATFLPFTPAEKQPLIDQTSELQAATALLVSRAAQYTIERFAEAQFQVRVIDALRSDPLLDQETAEVQVRTSMLLEMGALAGIIAALAEALSEEQNGD